MTSSGVSQIKGRPVVYDYGTPTSFLRDLLEYNKSAKKSYSLRSRVSKLGICSPSFVSQILNEQRQLNRDNLIKLTQVFELSPSEQKHIDEWLLNKAHPNSAQANLNYKKSEAKTPKNHLLTDWLNPYVKDLIQLKGFKADAKILSKMLKDIAPASKIQKSIEFLLTEGFWRKDIKGNVIPEDNYTETTNEISNEKIRQSHRKALKIAEAGIEAYTPTERKASTIILSINEENKAELRSLLDSFENQLTAFIEKHPSGHDEVVQVVMHLTPVGERYEK